MASEGGLCAFSCPDSQVFKWFCHHMDVGADIWALVLQIERLGPGVTRACGCCGAHKMYLGLQPFQQIRILQY